MRLLRAGAAAHPHHARMNGEIHYQFNEIHYRFIVLFAQSRLTFVSCSLPRRLHCAMRGRSRSGTYNSNVVIVILMMLYPGSTQLLRARLREQ